MLSVDTKFLLIGGFGLLGSAFSQHLAKLDVPYAIGSRTQKLDSNSHVILDIRNPGSLRTHLEDNLYTNILNFSGLSKGSSEDLFDTNVRGPLNLLEACLDLNYPARVTLIGSAAEYGDGGPEPIREDKALEPKNFYGLSKQMQSNLIPFFSRCGVNVNLARVFNVLDDNAPESSLPGKLAKGIKDLLDGKTSTIELGQLDGIRDYLESAKIAELLFLVNQRGESGEVYNVGSGIPTLNRDFVTRSLESSGLSNDVVCEQIDSGALISTIAASYSDIRKVNLLQNTQSSPLS